MIARLARTAVICSVAMTFAATAAAHFVWIDSKSTDGGLLIRSGFGEPEGWDPDLVDRMAKSTFWTRRGSELSPLAMPLDKTEREYRATVGGDAPGAVLAATDFGVIQFGNNPPSWLRYSAKHLVGAPDAWHDDAPTKQLRIEVLARRDGDDVTLRVMHLGQPLAGAAVKATVADGSKIELTTDEAGNVRLPAKASGDYALYVGATTPTAGEIDGKKYDVLKDYATLTFRIP